MLWERFYINRLSQSDTFTYSTVNVLRKFEWFDGYHTVKYLKPFSVIKLEYILDLHLLILRLHYSIFLEILL